METNPLRILVLRAHVICSTKELSQPEIICSKLTEETLEQGVKYVQN